MNALQSHNLHFVFLFLLLIINLTFCANIHVSSYRTDPTTIRPNQDFTLFFTLKNDMQIGVDNITVNFNCPQNFICPEQLTLNLASYGTQEVAVPIENNADGGIKQINISWQDGSYSLGVDANGNFLSTPKNLSMSFSIMVRPVAISKISATTTLNANQKNNFSIAIVGQGLSNVRASVYSSCMAFDTALFYFPSIDGTVYMNSSVFVNCKSGSADLALTIQSDELTTQVPLGVFVNKTAQAKLNVEVLSLSVENQKDRLQVRIKNDGAPAQKLYLYIISSSGVRSADMAYLGDFSAEKILYMDIQVEDVGDQPISIEARWVENQESFSMVWNKVVSVTKHTPPSIPSSFYFVIGTAVILCILWMTYSKISIAFSKKG